MDDIGAIRAVSPMSFAQEPNYELILQGGLNTMTRSSETRNDMFVSGWTTSQAIQSHTRQRTSAWKCLNQI